MDFLQELARLLADEGKHLRWISPAGVPWINCYNKNDTKRVHLGYMTAVCAFGIKSSWLWAN